MKTMMVIKLKNSSHQKNPVKLKTSDNKDLNNFVSLNHFKITDEKK